MTDRLSEGLQAIADRFTESHSVELRVLREDVLGDFRQGGPIRVTMILLLIVSSLPLLVQLHYRLVGQGLELLGLIAAVLTVAAMTVLAVKLRARALDSHSLGICNWAAISVVGGAAFAWWNGMHGPLLWGFIACGVVMLAILGTLHIQRRRDLISGRLRDDDPMDRATSLQESLRAALRSAGAPDASQAEHIEELVQRIVPMPEHRTFAQTPGAQQ